MQLNAVNYARSLRKNIKLYNTHIQSVSFPSVRLLRMHIICIACAETGLKLLRARTAILINNTNGGLACVCYECVAYAVELSCPLPGTARRGIHIVHVIITPCAELHSQ